MEQGSPAKSSCSSLEQWKQPNEQLSTHEFISGVPYFPMARQMEKRSRTAEADELPSSYLALLTAIQGSEAQQIGTSFSRAPFFVPYGNPDPGTPQTYSMLNVMLETPTQLRPMGMQGTRNPTNLASCGSNYAQDHAPSKMKRKMICEDDIAPNPRSWNSFLRRDQGYGSNSYSSSGNGYSLYDERFQALGLPVDPHLRMFNAIYGKGNAAGST